MLWITSNYFELQVRLLFFSICKQECVRHAVHFKKIWIYTKAVWLIVLVKYIPHQFDYLIRFNISLDSGLSFTNLELHAKRKTFFLEVHNERQWTKTSQPCWQSRLADEPRAEQFSGLYWVSATGSLQKGSPIALETYESSAKLHKSFGLLCNPFGLHHPRESSGV